ncbi:calcium-binding EF hand family protein [Zea mays]|uniref:Calcium-binding EF hand family protein n=1 Tax=Zea mays TaxID=4577 RepID=A0A1D6HUV6_MAIZE|nr:calcium-binding EF hand family protein [Zea mays]
MRIGGVGKPIKLTRPGVGEFQAENDTGSFGAEMWLDTVLQYKGRSHPTFMPPRVVATADLTNGPDRSTPSLSARRGAGDARPVPRLLLLWLPDAMGLAIFRTVCYAFSNVGEVCGVDLTDKVVDIIFHVFDANCDGNMSSEEFLRSLQRRENDIRQPATSDFLGVIACWLNCTKCSLQKMLPQ